MSVSKQPIPLKVSYVLTIFYAENDATMKAINTGVKPIQSISWNSSRANNSFTQKYYTV